MYRLIKTTDSFDKAFQFIDNASNEKSRILIHCAAGVSRSSTLLIAYLMKVNKWTFREAYEHVKKRRPIVSPNAGFLRQLLEFEKQLFNGRASANMTNSGVLEWIK